MELATLNKKMKINTDGPIVKSLDETLKSLNVCRQGYHGKSFVGNHVNKMLKVNTLIVLLIFYLYGFRL